MPKHGPGFLVAVDAHDNAVLDDVRKFSDDLGERDAVERDAAQEYADDSGSLAARDDEQLAREIAAIERASAALRKGEPALESWTNQPSATMRKARPIWLLIGVLWLSTALVTVGAAVAISALVG